MSAPIVIMPVFIGGDVDRDDAMAIVEKLAATLAAALGQQAPAAAVRQVRTTVSKAIEALPQEWINWFKANAKVVRQFCQAADIQVSKSGAIAQRTMREVLEKYPDPETAIKEFLAAEEAATAVVPAPVAIAAPVG